MPAAIKTTINFTPTFYYKLKQVATQQKKPMNLCIEEMMNPVLDKLQKEQLKRMYKAFFEMAGMIKDGPTDASTTIDEYLYGWGDSPRPPEEHGR
jgi:lauroyl/myristoyl acyltransferase